VSYINIDKFIKTSVPLLPSHPPCPLLICPSFWLFLAYVPLQVLHLLKSLQVLHLFQVLRLVKHPCFLTANPQSFADYLQDFNSFKNPSRSFILKLLDFQDLLAQDSLSSCSLRAQQLLLGNANPSISDARRDATSGLKFEFVRVSLLLCLLLT
jgi:hypothetical protein